jgi:hypothetical protein
MLHSVRSTPLPSKKLIASPTIINTFSPSLVLRHTPLLLGKRAIDDSKEEKKNLLLKYATPKIQEEDSYIDTEEDVEIKSLPMSKKKTLLQEINKILKKDDTIDYGFKIKEDK